MLHRILFENASLANKYSLTRAVLAKLLLTPLYNPSIKLRNKSYAQNGLKTFKHVVPFTLPQPIITSYFFFFLLFVST